MNCMEDTNHLECLSCRAILEDFQVFGEGEKVSDGIYDWSVVFLGGRVTRICRKAWCLSAYRLRAILRARTTRAHSSPHTNPHSTETVCA